MHECNVDEQRSLYNAQCEKVSKSMPDKHRFLLYFGKSCCIYCTLTEDMKRSSDATACESLIVCNYTKAELLQGSTNQIIVEAENF